MSLTYSPQKPTTLVLAIRQKLRRKPLQGADQSNNQITIALECYRVDQLTTWFEAMRIAVSGKYNPNGASLLSVNQFYMRLSKSSINI